MKKSYVLILLFLLVVACSKQSELHDAMETMEDSYKTMKKADSLDEMKIQLENFSAGLEIARQQKVKPEDQETFDAGMKKLTARANILLKAIESGDITEAKEALKELHELEEEFHEKLGVEH